MTCCIKSRAPAGAGRAAPTRPLRYGLRCAGHRGHIHRRTTPIFLTLQPARQAAPINGSCAGPCKFAGREGERPRRARWVRSHYVWPNGSGAAARHPEPRPRNHYAVLAWPRVVHGNTVRPNGRPAQTSNTELSAREHTRLRHSYAQGWCWYKIGG